jgi:hypothetical protein
MACRTCTSIRQRKENDFVIRACVCVAQMASTATSSGPNAAGAASTATSCGPNAEGAAKASSATGATVSGVATEDVPIVDLHHYREGRHAMDMEVDECKFKQPIGFWAQKNVCSLIYKWDDGMYDVYLVLLHNSKMAWRGRFSDTKGSKNPLAALYNGLMPKDGYSTTQKATDRSYTIVVHVEAIGADITYVLDRAAEHDGIGDLSTFTLVRVADCRMPAGHKRPISPYMSCPPSPSKSLTVPLSFQSGISRTFCLTCCLG